MSREDHAFHTLLPGRDKTSHDVYRLMHNPSSTYGALCPTSTSTKLQLFFILLLLGPPWSAQASSRAPMPPCSGSPNPAYATINAPLNIEVWTAADLQKIWTPPSCVGWTTRQASLLVAGAGRFRQVGNIDHLLQRLAAVSNLTTIRYWSVSRGRWNNLIDQAYALSTKDKHSRRADFSPAELRPGNDLYFWQDGSNRLETAVYRLHMLTRQADRLVFEVENASHVRLLFVTMFQPADLQVQYVLERESATVWRYYSLFRASGGANPLVARHKRSYINRTVAMFRYLAGMPTDREPPAAP